MNRVAGAALICLLAIALGCAFLLTRSCRRGAPKDDARAATPAGPRAASIVDAVFWLVNVNPTNRQTMQAGRVPRFADGAGGLAVAIHADGYFLTAAHAAYGDVHVFGRFEGNRLESRPATIVFQGDANNPADDFCVLRVEAALRVTLPWANAAQPSDSPLLAVVRQEDRLAIVAGRTLKTFDIEARSRAGLLETDIVPTGGDSGGPVLNAAGELLGVTSSVARRGWLRVARAGLVCSPRSSFVDAIVRHDQAARAIAPPTTIARPSSP